MSEFNIEEYINSLPNDIEAIHISHKSLTYIPCLKRFHKLKSLYCHYNQLTSLPKLNDSLQVLYCYHNQLTSLPELNDSLQVLQCSHNQLTFLPKLNHSLRQLYCYNNQLTFLPELNHSLQYLNCSYNQLTFLPKLNHSLQLLYCYDNQLTSLPKLNHSSLRELSCYNNQLTSLPELNHSLQHLYCNNNKFIIECSGYLSNQTKNEINRTFKCLDSCRHLFWSLKFKQKFRDWLWLKVRLPKIEKLYHPSKLNALLHDKNDDITEEELDKVISAW